MMADLTKKKNPHATTAICSILFLHTVNTLITMFVLNFMNMNDGSNDLKTSEKMYICIM